MIKKGFTLIELLAVIIIIGIIAVIAVPSILKVINNAKKSGFENATYGIIRAVKIGYTNDMLTGDEEPIMFTYIDGVETASVPGKIIDYEGEKPKTGTIKLDIDGDIAVAIHDGTYCAEKDYKDSIISISEKPEADCTLYTYYSKDKGVNAPILTSGMTPIKWTGTTWVDTIEKDSNWYNYYTKDWANVRTADGSFWVWVPRYAYQIESGFHTNTAGTINVKFLIDKTDKTMDKTGISLTPTYNGSNQTNYVIHPAFNFDGDDLPGIWVAKFEPSVANQSDLCYTNEHETYCNKTNLVAKIIPNVKSWRHIEVGNAFDVSLAMKDNITYGWQASEVDTHMMKNSEWGAVAYLSNSTYGKNGEVWVNPSEDFITGCAGGSVSAPLTSTCNQYQTINGVKASTTGTIYGIYDMVGGAWERVTSYINNSSPFLATYGSSILNANNKYKDVYAIGSPDAGANNYQANANVFGNAIYETSSTGLSSTSWYGDFSQMPFSSNPWLVRGGYGYNSVDAGMYSYRQMIGSAATTISFRPVIVVLDSEA